jgi:hypothetical protein
VNFKTWHSGQDRTSATTIPTTLPCFALATRRCRTARARRHREPVTARPVWVCHLTATPSPLPNPSPTWPLIRPQLSTSPLSPPPLKGHHPHGRRSPFPTSPFSCSKRAHCLSSAALHRVQSRLTGALPLPSSPSFRPHWCPLRSTELRHRLGNHRASVFHRPHRRHGSWVSPHRCLFVRHAAPAPLVLTPPPLPQLVRWCARACRASATTLRMVTMRVSAPSALRRLGPPRCLGC